MMSDKGTFAEVDLLLVTHPHGDHFNPKLTIEFLRHHTHCRLVAHTQVVDLLRKEEGFAQIELQIHEVKLDPGTYEKIILNGIHVDVLCLNHMSADSSMKNLAFIVELGGARFLHLGDSSIDQSEAHLNNYPFERSRVDILFLNRVDRSEMTRKFIAEKIKPSQIVAMHILPSELEEVSKNFRAVYPHAIIFKQSMERRSIPIEVDFHDPKNCDSLHASNVRSSYLEERACFHTKLIRRGPAPGSQNLPTPPAGIETITYASGDLNLRAWLSVPDAARLRPAPALVFFHGGSEQNAFFVEQAKAFRDAGFVVLFPMLRGENGNPGEWESLLGEIDDAAAAVRWIAAQPFVDPTRIYTYGHSTGAAVSLLLSMRNDAPVRQGGSSAGLFTEDSLKGWPDAPFDVNDQRERRMRTAINFIQTMSHRHVAYIGRDEYSVERVAEFRRLAAGSQLEIREVDGDHMGSLQPALTRFFEIVKSDAAMNQTGASRVGAVPVASPDARRAESEQYH
jgi:L-ascorbate metabolism protein UlaG (beta-lactamase superfamily)